jgi:alkylation response protein AidB-like acyl-CoA dehydrogenase
MELRYTPEQDDFRAEVRAWLAENVPTEPRPLDLAGMRAYDCDWQRRQFDGGWAGISWPTQYGGLGASTIDQIIWFEELAVAHAPQQGVNFVAVSNVGPALITLGTEAQKERYLMPILRGEEVWCEGFSEPDAGSDLASLRTKAVVDGDRLIVNGQKIWSTFSPVADLQQLLVRTSSDGPKQHGITCVICPLDTPGVTVRPIETMAGDCDFAEVFYDDVELPLENVVGEVDDGWRATTTTFGVDRSTALTGRIMALGEMVEELIRMAAARPGPSGTGIALDDAEVARSLGRLRADASALRAMAYLGLSRAIRTGSPGAEGSMLRLAEGEFTQSVTEFAMDLLGPDGLRWTDPTRYSGEWSNDYLWGRSRTISGGSKDIQRNIIGDRVLGLPRK